MVEFIIGQAGSGKTTRLFERIKENSDSGRKQYIIVPEQYSYEFDKSLYNFIGASRFNELYSLSFTSLARQLFQIYGDPNRSGDYADDMTRMILIYQALDAVRRTPGSLRYFHRRSLNTGFAEEVLTMIKDLKRSGIRPSELMERAAMLDKQLMEKTCDIASIYIEYDRLMTEYGLKDHLDNVREASELANLHRCFEGTDISIDEFESFTGDQLKMLRVLISSAENVTICLRTDNVDSGEFSLFETVNGTFRRLTDICREFHIKYKVTECGRSFRFDSPDLEYVSGHVMRNFRYEPENAPVPENITVFEAKDMYGEADYVCACIKRLINSDPDLKFRDIAVISNNIEQYADVLKAAFARYGIPYFLSIQRSVSHTPIMVFFSSLLDLLSARKIRSELMFRMLKCGILDYSLTDVSLLENYCYKWNVEDQVWCQPFTAPDFDLDKIEAMRKAVIEPILQLKKKLSGSRKASDICRALYEHLVSCEAEKSIGRLMSRLIRENRDYDAAELKRIWGCLIDILDSISDTLGDHEMTVSEAAKMIRSIAAQITYSVPPQTLDSVIAVSARTARLSAPKVVFCIGSNDGVFPSQINLHGLFSEADKHKLKERDIELSRSLADLIAAERLVVYKSLSAASRMLIVSYPLSDLSGQAKYAAPVVDQLLNMFGDKLTVTRSSQIPTDFYAVTYHAAYYHYMQDRALNSTSVESVRRVLLESPEYQRRLSYVFTRSEYSRNYTVDRDVMKKLKSFYPLELSATGIEEFTKCRFKYFCRYFMRLKESEKVDMNELIVGDLTHHCFHDILSKRSKQEFAELPETQLRSEIEECAARYKLEFMAGDFGKDPKFELMFRKLTERMTDVMCHTQNALKVSDFEPKEYELDLGDMHPIRLGFGDNYELSFSGVIDRLDTCRIDDKDYIRIIDYKSGQKTITAETLAGGLNLQMLLYLFAATEKNGPYDGYVPAGVLYSPVQIKKIKLESGRIDAPNVKEINTALKNSGLVLGNTAVLNAMEHGGAGRFIPAKLTSSGEIDESSGCVSDSSMERIKDLTYRHLKDTAEELLSGNCDAVPLIIGDKVPCKYCSYVNICDNSRLDRYRTPDPDKIAEAEEILSSKTNKGEEE